MPMTSFDIDINAAPRSPFPDEFSVQIDLLLCNKMDIEPLISRHSSNGIVLVNCNLSLDCSVCNTKDVCMS